MDRASPVSAMPGAAGWAVIRAVLSFDQCGLDDLFQREIMDLEIVLHDLFQRAQGHRSHQFGAGDGNAVARRLGGMVSSTRGMGVLA